MANFEDPFEEKLDFTPDEIGEETTEQVQAEAKQEPETEDKPDISLPEKYRGKSVEDVAKMHQELEKLNSRQAQEVGEHRKFVDDMLKRELLRNTAQQQSSQEIEEDPNEKFFKKPTEAMDEYLSNHPTIKQAQEQALMMKAQSAQQNLHQQFPDFVEIVKDPAFKEWVNASPIRQRLYDAADEGYDLTAATELFGTWKAISGSTQPAQQSVNNEVKENRSKSLKAASVDTGTSAISSNKKYSRKAIQDLLKNNPDKYYANSEEILQAYAEGRVY